MTEPGEWREPFHPPWGSMVEPGGGGDGGAPLVSLSKHPTSLETTQLMVQHSFHIHGIPIDIVSDWVLNLSLRYGSLFVRLLDLQSVSHFGYLPQSKAQTERCNQAVNVALRCIKNNNSSTWSQHLAWIEYPHNSLTSSATHLSLSEASLGYSPPLFPRQEAEKVVPSVQHHQIIIN